MANHGYLKTGKELSSNLIDELITKINKEKFHDVLTFTVFESYSGKNWQALIDDYNGIQFWISDDVEYGEVKDDIYTEYVEPKVITKKSVLEFRHGYGFSFMWWLEGVITIEFQKQLGGEFYDDGFEGKYEKPEKKYETFYSFIETNSFFAKMHKSDLPFIPEKFVKEFKLNDYKK